MGAVSPTILSWITAEVNQALKLVRDNIAKFTAAPDDEAALSVCPGHLHQVSGALRMVGLAGATRFCEAIEGSFVGLSGQKAARTIGTVDKAVLALKEFVDDLERGQANVPLRLYPFYRDLATLQGRTDPSEKELFFPDLTEEVPAHSNPVVLHANELAPYLQAQRARFQKGLLASLRNQPGGLEEMRAALDAMHQVAAMLPEPRGLWWAAVGFVDGLKGDKDAPPDPEWVAASKVLCNKLDFQIRDLAAGAKAVNEQVMRELLYALAKSKATSARVKVVKTHYQLDSLFPEPSMGGGVMEFNMEWLQPALNDARSRLEALKSVWVQYISGEPKSALRFRELVASFKAKAGELGSQPLVKLLDVISLVGAKLPDPYPQQSQLLVIEMASAFLLAESMIETFTSPPPDADQQITIMGGWLLDAAKGKSTGEPPARLRADLSQQISALQLRAQVAREILANLHHVEQVLDAFARDAAKRHTLKELEPFLRQIRGALSVLGFQRAVDLLQICEKKIEACADPDHPQTAEDMDWVAEGLSSLGFFLDPCLKGREPVEQAITLFFERFEKSTAPAAPAPAPVIELVEPVAAAPQPEPVIEPVIELAAEPEKPAQPAPAAAQQPAVNEELLAIYLEEAGEVLANITGGLAQCRAQPGDRDALTTIRRGFHTLKGSGRMVGLTDLGEIAWQIEQVMNRWLEQQRVATPRLLELIAMAAEAFAGWVEQLRAKQPLVLEAQAITELAQRVKSDEEPEPAPVAAPAPAAPAEAPAEQEEITIGSTRLLRSFLEIYLNEAAQHIAVLESEFPLWRSAPTDASHEFHRAAHTLASSSRTAGFSAIADLAGALEHWMPLARNATRPEDAQTLQSAIAKLKDMVDSISARQVPASMQDALNAMQQMTLRLQTPPPPSAPAVEPKAPLAVVKPAAPAPKAPAAPAAAAAPAAKGGRENRVMRDDIDDQLLPIFLEEAQELLPQIGSDLRDWKANTADQNVSASLRRALHTLKGSARMAGAIRLGELTHIMESRIEAAFEADQFTAELFADLEDKMDRLSLDLERMGGTPSLAAAPAAAVAAPAAAAKPAESVADAAAPRAEPPLPAASSMLRVNADTLDHLINESGEVSIARSRVEAELRVIKQSLSDLNDSIARMRGQLREVEVQADSQMQSRLSVLEERDRDFDPLEFDRYTRLQELTRLMAESLHDATSIQQGLLKNLGETEAALAQQSRTSRDVQQQLMHMRAVPFSNLNERLYRIVRQTARELGKKAELEIQGSQVELDRGVLEKISAPLEHMLRNALAHGLEMPEARIAAGKPDTGRITINLRQESNEMALIMTDDGAGLDLDKLRAKALAKGVLREDENPSEHDLMGLVFVSGLSTADAVTELSGRGVGMDVVRNDLTSIGGRIDIATKRGQGTTFTVYLPLTLAVTQAVLVRAGESVLAFSSATVEQVLRLKEDALAGLYEKKQVDAQDHSYPLYYLRDLLGGAPVSGLQGYNSVLLVRSGIQRVALHVDELIGNQEIVVKSIGPQLQRVAGVGGATVLPDGRIVLIVNPVQLAQRARGAPVREMVREVPAEKAPAPIIMVVDDSLTVRKITSRLLEREGYRVMTAKDGLDALQQMRDTLPAVMLVDIEMPRMDGFDLARNVRGDPRTHGIPIVIISSRTADKHRNQAAQLGVNAFLGKPYEESELLSHILNFLGAASQPATYH